MNKPSSSHTDIVPSMSFLMITYNQEKTIEQALKSALAQDYPNMERRLSGAVLIRKNEAARQ